MRNTLRWLVLPLVWSMAAAGPLSAQGPFQPEIRFGLGTFLSHDRGWNYAENVEFFASVGQSIGSVQVDAGVSLFKSFAEYAKPAVVPPYPTAYRDGIGARLHLRAPAPDHSPLSVLVGLEILQNRTADEERGTTVAGTAGLAFNFGPARRGTVDFRYVRFAEPLGSSRGILPLTVGWRL